MTQHRRAIFFAHQTRHHGDIETNNTTAHPRQGTVETDITSAPENCTKKHPFRTRKGDDGFNPTQAGTSNGDTGFRQPAAWLARPDCGPVGGGGAWPGFETTHRTRQQRPGAAGVEGTGGP